MGYLRRKVKSAIEVNDTLHKDGTITLKCKVLRVSKKLFAYQKRLNYDDCERYITIAVNNTVHYTSLEQ